MSNILSKILESKKRHIANRKKNKPEKELLDAATLASPSRGFASYVSNKARNNINAIIGEIKKASPSAGVIRNDFEPIELAKAYVQGGATCLSILTDETYFKGKEEYIRQVREVVDVPVLRKDFIIDTYQVAESRALEADAILLIMAAVNDEMAHKIEENAIALGMDVLIEVHNEEDLERALKLQSTLIGINNRDLKTMKTSLKVTETLAPLVPKDSGYTIVCESGIKTKSDIKKMNDVGVHAFLVGESIMKAKNVAEATKKLL